jgi:hypothetical protein
MKARRLILTAGVVVALAGPAAQTVGAQLPLDGGGSRPLKVALKEIKATVHQNKKAKSSATAINASTYSAYAYVQGGASQKVGKAITKAGKKLAKVHQSTAPKSHPRSIGEPAVRGQGAGANSGTSGVGAIDSDPNACAQSSICTPQELCTIWGMGCLQLEQPGPAIEVAASSDQLPATDSTDSTDSSASGSSDTSPALLGADATDTSSLYEDC